MSRSIEIADSTYSQLEAAAAAEGTTPDQWLAARLSDVLPPVKPSEFVTGENGAPRTLYDLIKHRVGNFSFDCTDLAERHSEYFAEGVLEKRRMGTL